MGCFDHRAEDHQGAVAGVGGTVSSVQVVGDGVEFTPCDGAQMVLER